MIFHIVIQLSAREIAFYYCRQGNDGRLRPFEGAWPAPLAVYSHGTELEIGEAALTAARQQVAGAYTDVFKVATQSGFFDLNGMQTPLNKLLLYGLEYYIRKFLKETLMQNAGTLDDLRASMPLHFIFDVNLKPNQTEYVIDLFRNNGYGNVDVIDYNKYILKLLSTETPEHPFTVFSSDGSDLYFRYYGNKWTSDLVKLPGLGFDKRLDKAIKSIIADIKDYDPYITEITEKEQERVYKAAKSFLDSGERTVNDTITLDDGREVSYYLTLISLGTSGESSELLRSSVKAEFEQRGINPKTASMVLKGRNICNSYFRDSLRQLFDHYYEVSGDRQVEVFNLIAKELLAKGPLQDPLLTPLDPQKSIPSDVELKKLRRRLREIISMTNGMLSVGRKVDALAELNTFKQECLVYSGIEDIIEKIDNQIAKIHIVDGATPPEQPSNPTPGTQPVSQSASQKDISKPPKELERPWRNIKQEIKANLSQGKHDEARRLCKEFKAWIRGREGEATMLEIIKAKLARIDAEASKIESTKIFATPTGSNKSQNTHKTEKQAEVSKNPNKVDQGECLIAQGKLKEARDWYRTEGNSQKANMLSNILRAQKGVEVRKKSLEECRKNKNAEQIGRIIAELQDYIDLCGKIGFGCDEYKKLMTEYKKIINPKK